MPIEIRELISLKLNGSGLRQLSNCNKQWANMLSNEEIWNRLLNSKFQIEPFAGFSAKKSYFLAENWPKNSKRISDIICRTMELSPFKISNEVKNNVQTIIQQIEPIKYANKNVVWLKIQEKCQLFTELEFYVNKAIKFASTPKKEIIAQLDKKKTKCDEYEKKCNLIEDKVKQYGKLVKEAKSGTKKQLIKAKLELEKVNLELDQTVSKHQCLMVKIYNIEQLLTIQ